MLARALARLPWMVGNDGLTTLERRRLARQWRKGLGSIPSREASLQALQRLDRPEDYRQER